MSEDLSHKAAKGTIWASADRIGCMVLQFLINLVLARLLTPGDFGAVGMLAIFISVSNVLVDGGFASALIQKKNPTQTDWSTIFFWNLGLSCLLYLIIFLSAPAVARYFHMPVLTGVLRGIGLTLILGAMNAIQLTRLRKQFAFRTIAIANISAYVVSGLVACALAFSGWGVWSLVVMQVLQMMVILIIFSVLTRWRPALVFSLSTLRTLFGYGGYLLGANILQEIAKNLQGIIIGRRFSATAMGYYSQAYKLDRITSYSLPQVIVQVMFPLYSSLQDDLPALRDMLLRNVRVIAILIFPTMGILIFTAPDLIGFLYGDQWLPAAPYFRILCLAGMFACLQNINYYAVAARGASRTLFLWSFWKWGFLLSALFTGAAIAGMDGLMWAMVAGEANIYIVNAALAARHTGLPLRRQLLALCPIVLAVAGAYLAAMLTLPYTGTLISALLLALFFLAIARLARFSALTDAMALLKKILKKMTIDKALNDELRARFNPDGSQLRAVQLRLLEMLKRFDALCREHGIKYWLSSGTCLGAMRHGGFIPWDDDVDIDIEYSDFRRLRRILRQTPPEGYVYQDRHSDPEYVLTFPKLRDLHSHIDELNLQDRRWRFRGCYIDIFPMVRSSSLWIHKRSRNAHHILVRRPERIKNTGLRQLMLSIGFGLFYGIANPVFRLAGYFGRAGRLRHMPGSLYTGARNALDFREVKYVPFEDTLLPVPADADAYLTRIFRKLESNAGSR